MELHVVLTETDDSTTRRLDDSTTRRLDSTPFKTQKHAHQRGEIYRGAGAAFSFGGVPVLLSPTDIRRARASRAEPSRAEPSTRTRHDVPFFRTGCNSATVFASFACLPDLPDRCRYLATLHLRLDSTTRTLSRSKRSY